MTSLKGCFDTLPGTECHRTRRGCRFTTLCMAGAWFALIAQASLAACSIAATPVVFGSYAVFSASPNDSGIGTLTIVCGGGPGNNYPVTLSTGQSGSYASRVMKSGANPLSYNLYTNAARTTIWGDGTGGTSFMTAPKNSTTNLSAYGRIPAGQDATVGTYIDNITATVTF